MKTVIRADASTFIGSGHIMRCLTLAHSLREAGAQIQFICRELPGHLCDYITDEGFDVHRLSFDESKISNLLENAKNHSSWLAVSEEEDSSLCREVLQKLDLLIVDHYGIGGNWESSLRHLASKIMIVDDLADRSHDCDFLLDQNYYQHGDSRYSQLVPRDCTMFLGPKYALVRPEFLKLRDSKRATIAGKKNILVCFGGVDRENATLVVARALRPLCSKELQFTIITGAKYPHRKELEEFCKDNDHLSCYSEVKNMAQFMNKADLAIGGSGGMSWERCCLGLPSLTIILAENQRGNAIGLDQYGAAALLGTLDSVTEKQINSTVNYLCHTPKKLKEMENRARSLVDGKGVSRVINVLLDKS